VRTPFRLLEASIVKPTQTIPSPETTRRIRYRVKAADAVALFPPGRRQSARAEGDGTILLDVTSDSPDTGEAGPEQVEAVYTKANPLVDSNDSLVVKHMRAAVGDRRDPWEKAVAIMDWVADNVRRKNFQVAFAPAGSVAKDLSGDCTEHAVLLAAMCRAAGIPTRCAVGIVYAEPLGGFGPHMWNEVYVNRRWVALDSAFKQSQVDATHIKMLDTSLDGVSPFEAFMPVLQVFQNLSIEPLEIRR
jgi:transglutaminase-like putative cysteine protease